MKIVPLSNQIPRTLNALVHVLFGLKEQRHFVDVLKTFLKQQMQRKFVTSTDATKFFFQKTEISALNVHLMKTFV